MLADSVVMRSEGSFVLESLGQLHEFVGGSACHRLVRVEDRLGREEPLDDDSEEVRTASEENCIADHVL